MLQNRLYFLAAVLASHHPRVRARQITTAIERLPGAELCRRYFRATLLPHPPSAGPALACWPGPSGQPAASPMAECRGVLEAICRHRCAWPFLEEASRLCPEYLRQVPRPMDLGPAMARLKAGAYVNPQQLRREVSRVWRNCVAYCGEDDAAAAMARELAAAFDSLYADRVYHPSLRACRAVVRNRAALVGEAVEVRIL